MDDPLAEAADLIERGELDAAERALATFEPDDADARYLRARCHEARGDRAAMIAEFLEVRRLDEAHDQEDRLVHPEDRRFIAEVAEETLASLPAAVAARLENVAVVLADRPPKDVVAEGFDPRAYGLFEGPTDAAELDVAFGPTRVVLFVANLVADFGDDDDLIAEETRTTVLHEIGHYFGLDEDEVAELGLA